MDKWELFKEKILYNGSKLKYWTLITGMTIINNRNTSFCSCGSTAFVALSYTPIACLAKPCSSSSLAYSR